MNAKRSAHHKADVISVTAGLVGGIDAEFNLACLTVVDITAV